MEIRLAAALNVVSQKIPASAWRCIRRGLYQENSGVPSAADGKDRFGLSKDDFGRVSDPGISNGEGV